MKETLVRILTAAIAIPITIFLVVCSVGNNITFFLLLLFCITLIYTEISDFMKKQDFHFYLYWTSIATFFLFLLAHLKGMQLISSANFIYLDFWVFLIYMVVIILLQLRNTNIIGAMNRITFHLLIFIFVGFFSSFAILLRDLPSGALLLMSFMAIAWVSDAGGYFCGKYLGRNRIKDLVSKSKTIEGYIGAITLGTLLGLILYFLQDLVGISYFFTLQWWLITGAFISILSQIGDLFESLIKRFGATKDSGTILPGMGGMYDAIDSIIFVCPWFYMFIVFFG